ncbi:plasmid mobilization protein [Tunturiibacter psychrotolerans]
MSAGQAGLTTSEYLRRCALGKSAPKSPSRL